MVSAEEHEHDGVTPGHVRPHQIPHLRIDPRFDLLRGQSVAEFLHVRQWPPAQTDGGRADEFLELGSARFAG